MDAFPIRPVRMLAVIRAEKIFGKMSKVAEEMILNAEGQHGV